MLSYNQLFAYMLNELPELAQELDKLPRVSSVFKTVKCLISYTRKKAKLHDFKTVKKCFAVADKIYSDGDTIIQKATENLFVYSFSAMMRFSTKEEKRKLHALVPLGLYTAYIQLFFKSNL